MDPPKHIEDQRQTKIGRVVAFQVRFPEGRGIDLAAKDRHMRKALCEVRDGDLERPGFEPPKRAGDVLTTCYHEATDRKVTRFGQEHLERVPVSTKVFDMMGDRRQGYILVGARTVTQATAILSIYLEALGYGLNDVAYMALAISQDTMKTVFHDPRFVRRTAQGGKLTQARLHSRLGELTSTPYYDALAQQGFEEEPWDTCDLAMPARADIGRAPPVVKLWESGFTVLASYLDGAVWEYVNDLLLTLEEALRVPRVAKKTQRNLVEFINGARPLQAPTEEAQGRP